MISYFPDDEIKLSRDMIFRSPDASGINFTLAAGTTGILLRRLTNNGDGKDLWVICMRGRMRGWTLRIREEHFQPANLLERLAQEVSDADALSD